MSEIIPFSKYRGQPVEVLAQNRPYLEWLRGQSWFTSRYQNINTLIINNFKEPAETPEHNKLQALFLDEIFLSKFIAYLKIIGFRRSAFENRQVRTNNGPWEDAPFDQDEWDAYQYGKVSFEKNGIDVSFSGPMCDVNIEIKPMLSHDYPAVLRQMKATRCSILFIEAFLADGLTIEQVRKIFNPIIIILKSDIDKLLPL